MPKRIRFCPRRFSQKTRPIAVRAARSLACYAPPEAVDCLALILESDGKREIKRYMEARPDIFRQFDAKQTKEYEGMMLATWHLSARHYRIFATVSLGNLGSN